MANVCLNYLKKEQDLKVKLTPFLKERDLNLRRILDGISISYLIALKLSDFELYFDVTGSKLA